jgi:hypothetical protein
MLQGTLAWAGDSLAAIDQLQRPVHVTLWDPEGGVSTRNWPGDASPAYPTLYSGGARLYGTGMLITPNEIASWDDPPQPKPVPTPQVVAFDGDESRLLPVSGSGLLEFRLNGVNCGTPDDFIHPMELPFSDGGPFIAFLPGGEMARATRDGAFRIDVLDAGSGRIVRTYRRDVQPRPVSDEVWEADRWVRDARTIESEHGELTAQGGTPCPVLNRPTHEPLMRSMVSDEQGRLWVESTTARGTTLTGIGPRGELLGEVMMPTRDRRVAPYVRANKLYLTTVDDLDVQSVEVFDLVRE